MPKNKIYDKLVKLCYSIYPKKISALLLKPGDEIYPYLKKNRLDHFFALKYNQDSELIDEYKSYKSKLVNSLKILKNKLKGKDFIVIKTFSSYPHTTGDLDIVVKDAMVADKFKNISLPIAFDINHKISWTNDEEISFKFIWANIEVYQFEGINILIPNAKLDTLIRFAHLPYEQAEIRLGELLHIYKQLGKINWSSISKEAAANNWPKTFRKTKIFFDKIHSKLFNESNYIDFPHRLPILDLTMALFEKKAWQKIWGGRYVLKHRLGL